MELTDKQMNRMENGREYRAMVMSMRAADQPDDDGKMIVEGYAATFNQPYVLYSDRYYRLLEVIAPEAFVGCDMSDVIMQYDHEGRVFARNKNGTLTLSTDSVGLKITADLSGTDIGRQLYQEIKGGYTDKMSFAFLVGKDKRETIEDREAGVTIVTRTILSVKKLFDVSAVSIPTNDMTSISARRLADGVIQKAEAERLLRAKQKIKIMMEVMT